MKQSELNGIVNIIRNIAKNLEECGIDEWDDMDDCINATKNNLYNDLKEFVHLTNTITKE